jgi:hypothetical protein
MHLKGGLLPSTNAKLISTGGVASLMYVQPVFVPQKGSSPL